MEGTKSPSEYGSSTMTCEICSLFHETRNCTLLTNGVPVHDTPVPPKAFLTLPDCLEAIETKDGTYEIFTKKVLKTAIQFGPMEAPRKRTVNPNSPYLLCLKNVTGSVSYLDLTDPSKCNWMSMVKFSTMEEKSNCVCYQWEGKIYFSVMRLLVIGTELVVTYSSGYSNFVNEQNVFDILPTKEEQGHKECSNIRKKNRPSFEEWDDSENTEKFRHENEMNPHKKLKQRKLDSCVKDEEIKPLLRFCNDIYSTDDELEYASLDAARRESLKRMGPCLALDEWSCKFCQIVFPNISEFGAHLILHYKLVGAARSEKRRKDVQDPLLEEEEKFEKSIPTYPYVCDICENKKTFNRAEYIIRHLKKHSLWSQCNKCGQIVRGESQLHTCIEKIYSGKSKGAFPCLLCKRSFKSSANLETHNHHKHKGSSRGAAVRQIMSSSFICFSCPKRFLTKECWKTHSCGSTTNQEDSSQITNELDSLEGEFVCCICKENFQRGTLLDVHLRTHTHEATVTCSICNKSVSQKKLKMHDQICQKIQDFSTGTKPDLSCPLCQAIVPDIYEFRTHIGHHTHPIMCPACQLRLSSRDELKCHQCNQFPCDGCIEAFESFLDLRTHIKHIHEKADFYCYECAFPFVTQEGYREHTCEIRSELKPVLKVVGSDVDVNVSPKQPALKPLKKRTRRHEDGEFICEVCGASYTKFSSLKTHRYTHGPRHHSCDTCGKKFHRRELLADHLFVHLPPQFECTVCNKRLKSRKALEVHSRIHEGKKPYQCDVEGCGKAFTQKVNLMTHLNTHAPLSEKSLQCPYCLKKYSSVEGMNTHVRSHEENNNFQCDLCSKAFYREGLLLRHKRSAHAQEKFNCEYCEKVLKQKNSLLKHLQKWHIELTEIFSQPGYLETRRLKPVEFHAQEFIAAEVEKEGGKKKPTKNEMEIDNTKDEEEEVMELEEIDESSLMILHVDQTGEIMLSLQEVEEVTDDLSEKVQESTS